MQWYNYFTMLNNNIYTVKFSIDKLKTVKRLSISL